MGSGGGRHRFEKRCVCVCGERERERERRDRETEREQLLVDNASSPGCAAVAFACSGVLLRLSAGAGQERPRISWLVAHSVWVGEFRD